MPSFLSTDVFKMCSRFGFDVGTSIDADDGDRCVNVHRIAFPFDVAVDVGAQCKVKAFPFGIKIALFWSGGKSLALFAVIELITLSEC